MEKKDKEKSQGNTPKNQRTYNANGEFGIFVEKAVAALVKFKDRANDQLITVPPDIMND